MNPRKRKGEVVYIRSSGDSFEERFAGIIVLGDLLTSEHVVEFTEILKYLPRVIFDKSRRGSLSSFYVRGRERIVLLLC